MSSRTLFVPPQSTESTFSVSHRIKVSHFYQSSSYMRLLEFNFSFTITLNSRDYKFDRILLVCGENEIEQEITTFES